MLGHGEVERLDGLLASLARAETALRLRLGQLLEVLGQGKCFELGFSSIAAYALERCDRSARWVEAARTLARRLEQLPQLRRAMAFGQVSWSMGELLARVAQPEDEARWIETAESRTVRQVRVLVREALERGAARSEEAVRSDDAGAVDGEEESCTLTCTVNQEEAWLFEATRTLLGQLGAHGSDAQVEALLAEGQGLLLGALPAGALDVGRCVSMNNDQRRWLSVLSRWRAEAEALCEGHFRGSVVEQRVLEQRRSEPVEGPVGMAVACGLGPLESAGCHELDGRVRELSRALARHELELSRLVLAFHRADAWRRLGYASEAQYARERLGMSRSSLVARRALALRLEKLPRVAEALGSGQLGVEAALQVVRVATPGTQGAWVNRARNRTIKHLREEVGAALVAARLSGEAECPPPVDADMAAFHELEQAVVSGRACRPLLANAADVARGANVHDASEAEARRVDEPVSEQRRAWLVMLGSLARWLEGGLQMSAGRSMTDSGPSSSSAGRIELRWRVSRANYTWWRGLEAQARRWLPCGMSWLRFLCLSVWQAWRHLLGTNVAYGQVYIRDRFRCTSPVCNRRDVTPHHLQFRSAGGSDADDNVAAVCTWCHLYVCTAGEFVRRGRRSSFIGSWGLRAVLVSWCMAGARGSVTSGPGLELGHGGQAPRCAAQNRSA